MEVRLSRKDLQILDTGGRAKPSERPFGYVTPFDPLTNSDDIVEVLIHDENQNFLERGVVDVEDVIFSSDGVRLKTGVILRKFGYDPAIAGGVVITTFTDIIGFVSFLGIISFLIA